MTNTYPNWLIKNPNDPNRIIILRDKHVVSYFKAFTLADVVNACSRICDSVSYIADWDTPEPKVIPCTDEMLRVLPTHDLQNQLRKAHKQSKQTHTGWLTQQRLIKQFEAKNPDWVRLAFVLRAEGYVDFEFDYLFNFDHDKPK